MNNQARRVRLAEEHPQGLTRPVIREAAMRKSTTKQVACEPYTNPTQGLCSKHSVQGALHAPWYPGIRLGCQGGSWPRSHDQISSTASSPAPGAGRLQLPPGQAVGVRESRALAGLQQLGLALATVQADPAYGSLLDATAGSFSARRGCRGDITTRQQPDEPAFRAGSRKDGRGSGENLTSQMLGVRSVNELPEKARMSLSRRARLFFQSSPASYGSDVARGSGLCNILAYPTGC